ncbi:MAG: Gfo/Idh/MocA family oxidoreductase [Thermoguttaceae bacterium]
MKKLKIAVIGAGRLGGFHAQKLAKMPEEDLAAVVDPLPANRQRVASECRCPALADYRGLLGRIDAAVIAAPTACHYQLAKDFLESNTHLLVEKPLCLNSRQADELVALAQTRNLVLQVGHVERFNPAFSASIPHLGNPKYIETVRTSGYTFRSTDVGAVLDLMIHDLDLVLSIARGRVQKVDAVGLKVVGKDEDVANARIQFQNGCVANLSVSRVSRESVRRMQVWTPLAFTGIDFAARTATLVRPSETLHQGAFDVDALSPEQVEHCRRNFADEHLPCEQLQFDAVDALALEVQDFVEAIRTPRKPLVDGQAGRDAVAMAETILDRIHAQWAASGSDTTTDSPRHIIPVPHLPLASDSQPGQFREAG